MSFFVYCLVSNISRSTYIGATVDLDHRLRQHNKEIKGGAHATSIIRNQGQTWERACYVKGFPSWQAALQFEWRWKQISRKLPIKMDPLTRRTMALIRLLSLDQSTKNAIPYDKWETAPEVIVETSDAAIRAVVDESDVAIQKKIIYIHSETTIRVV